STVNVKVDLPIPDALTLNEESPLPFLVETPGRTGVIDPKNDDLQKVDPPSKRFTIPVEFAKDLKPDDKFDLTLSVQAFVCNKGSKFCTIKNYVWTVP